MNHELIFKRFIFGFTAALLMASPLLIKPFNKLKSKGLNSRAWRASYTERHLMLPSGPRDGWWGTNLSPTPDPQLGYTLPERHIPGLLEIDQKGLQSALGSPHAHVHLLIVGGSVAAGAYASNAGRTYFHQLAHHLSALSCPVRVTVLAAGAWTSVNELNAFRLRGIDLHPDYVLFLDGLNDLTLFKDWPEKKRVAQYLDDMRQARDLALAHHIKVIFAPQPFLPEKPHKTGFEVLIVAESYPRVDRLIEAKEELVEGLRSLTKPGEVYLVDCSDAFDKRKKTVFADIWHFSDIGHAILGTRLAHDLAPILISECRPRPRP